MKVVPEAGIIDDDNRHVLLVEEPSTVEAQFELVLRLRQEVAEEAGLARKPTCAFEAVEPTAMFP